MKKRFFGILFVLLICASCSVIPSRFEKQVKESIELIKEETYKAFDELSTRIDYENYYFEIKNTRVLYDFKVLDDDKAANREFSNVKYIVEFIIYTNYYGASIYYNDFYPLNCVVFCEDGSKYASIDYMHKYFNYTYDYDLKHISFKIEDYGGKYNLTTDLKK